MGADPLLAPSEFRRLNSGLVAGPFPAQLSKWPIVCILLASCLHLSFKIPTWMSQLQRGGVFPGAQTTLGPLLPSFLALCIFAQHFLVVINYQQVLLCKVCPSVLAPPYPI